MKIKFIFWGTFLVSLGILLLLSELDIYFIHNISWHILVSIVLIIWGTYYIFQKNQIARILLIIALSISISLTAFKFTENIFDCNNHPKMFFNYQ